MLKNICLTHHLLVRKQNILASRSTLSCLSFVCENYNGKGGHASKLQPSSPSKTLTQKLHVLFPSAAARGAETHNNEELNYVKRNQEELVRNVESELFHFHSTCQPETITSVSSSYTVIPNFITIDEENLLMKEIEPHLKRMKYEFNHWDDAIHGFREIERSRWSQQSSIILNKIRQVAFPDSYQHLPQTHVLDLDKAGVIKPHVDSVRFCGSIISGLCLVSDAVMRLRHVEMKDQIVDILLKRGSLYIMRDEARYKYTHEVLGEEESFFKGETVERGRRVSIISRIQPTGE